MAFVKCLCRFVRRLQDICHEPKSGETPQHALFLPGSWQAQRHSEQVINGSDTPQLWMERGR